MSLMGHQKAALQILTQLYTPHTILQSFVGRMMLTWYVRFDVFVGMLGGFETRLPREWFSTTVEYWERQAPEDESELHWKLEAASASLRLISVDMSNLYAKAGRGDLAGDVFAAEYERLTTMLYHWRRDLDPALTSPSHQVADFGWREPLREDDVFDPYVPGFLYKGSMFPMSLLLAEWHSVLVMHLSQEPGRLQQEPTQEMRNLAMGICQIVASVERWPARPHGTMAMLHACLVIAALFIPKEERYQMWMRRKYVLIEQLGYAVHLPQTQDTMLTAGVLQVHMPPHHPEPHGPSLPRPVLHRLVAPPRRGFDPEPPGRAGLRRRAQWKPGVQTDGGSARDGLRLCQDEGGQRRARRAPTEGLNGPRAPRRLSQFGDGNLPKAPRFWATAGHTIPMAADGLTMGLRCAMDPGPGREVGLCRRSLLHNHTKPMVPPPPPPPPPPQSDNPSVPSGEEGRDRS